MGKAAHLLTLAAIVKRDYRRILALLYASYASLDLPNTRLKGSDVSGLVFPRDQVDR